MSEDGHQAAQSNPIEKDPYDEFEERMLWLGRAIQTCWRELTLHERIAHVLTATGALVLIIYTTYTVKIYKANHDAANATAKAATVAAQSMALDQEAWLMLDTDYSDHHFDPSENTDYIRVPIQFQNIGRTPARNMHGYIVVTEVTVGDTPIIDFDHACCRNGVDAGLIYPTAANAHTTFADEFTDIGSKVKPSIDKGKQFSNRQLHFVIWGKITYDDIFTRSHWMTFCHTITKAEKPTFCIDKNTIDTVQLPH